MAQLRAFQTREASGFQGMAQGNHINSMFEASPQRAENFYRLLQSRRYGENLETLLNKLPVKEFDTSEPYFWELIGEEDTNVAIKEARDMKNQVIAPGTMAGVGGEHFLVVFPIDWFAHGNVIVGELNEVYPLRVIGSGRPEGTNTVYEVELMGGNRTGMPAEELTLGKRFSVEFSPVEKGLSRKVGDIRFTSPIALSNEFTQIRIQAKISGEHFQQRLQIGMPYVEKATGKVKTLDTWAFVVEDKLERTFGKEKNTALMYGRSNKDLNGEYNNYGDSGNVIKQGAGLREQMEVSNVVYYNDFDIKLIEEALYGHAEGSTEIKDRRYVLRTGERGASQFHKAIMKEAAGWKMFTFEGTNVGAIKKVNSPLHDNALSVGFQFVEYKAPNGVVVNIEVDPSYDNKVRNKIMHHKGGVAESYRYDIFYLGSAEQPNIQLARVKGAQEHRGFQAGMRNPFTNSATNMFMSHDEDSATAHRMTCFGVILYDSDLTMSIIPSELAG